jgi:2-polyprenyl-3-methyl-5-hydroxy-6-metoxy-1,4-benzoquinol methylase
MVGEWPNGWKGSCNYVPQDNVAKALSNAGFSVEKKSLLIDETAKVGVDLKRVAELVPYNVFIATKLSDSVSEDSEKRAEKQTLSGEALKANAIKDYDQETAKLYDGVVSCTQHKYILGHTLKTLAGDVTGLRCLDAGCGNGEYMRHFYEKGASFCAGVDLSNENLDIAKANHKASGVPEGVMSYIQGDLTKPKPVNSGKFDLVVSNCVVCYASNQEELLGFMKMAHVNLKVGGRFVLINTRQALP